MVGEQFVENKSSRKIKLYSDLFNKLDEAHSILSALGQPLWMATHALDWEDTL